MFDPMYIPRIVIYGGGVAGALLAKKLSPEFKITLVDPNEYFEVPMAVPRSLVNAGFAEQAIIPFAAALPGVDFVRGALCELRPDGGVVALQDGSQRILVGDVSVLATGSMFSNSLMRAIGGASIDERKTFYARYQQRIAASRHILIVGGGPIGVEVAGEISENYPETSVTIVEAGPRLLAGTSDSAAEHAAKLLTARGVKLLTGERIQHADAASTEVFSSAGEAFTDRGRRLSYDLLIWCTGGKPNTEYMTRHFASALNAQGRIRVTPELRVVGSATTFALGDITDLDENKMAWHIAGQVKTAAHNIQVVLKRSSRFAPLKTYQPRTGNPMMAVTLGSRAGVLHLPIVGVVRAPFVNRIAKAGHMLVPKFRRALGI